MLTTTLGKEVDKAYRTTAYATLVNEMTGHLASVLVNSIIDGKCTEKEVLSDIKMLTALLNDVVKQVPGAYKVHKKG
jgi:hypothetical protein